jgi:hypothetical protein
LDDFLASNGCKIEFGQHFTHYLTNKRPLVHNKLQQDSDEFVLTMNAKFSWLVDVSLITSQIEEDRLLLIN